MTQRLQRMVLRRLGSHLISKQFLTIKHVVTPKSWISVCFYHKADLPKMRFVQYLRYGDKKKHLGVVSEDGTKIAKLSELQKKTEDAQTEEINETFTLLAPISNPDKIICVGLNYKDHCEEQNKKPPSEPMFFSKYNNAITSALGDVIAHKQTAKLDWEVELAVIIGKECYNVPKSRAMEYVFGYTVAQDISARDWQKERNGGQFLIGKSMDSFLPIGPSIVHKSLITNPYELHMTCKINGVEKQNGTTSNMIFKIDDIISRLSETITLLPGDIILTGTPKGVGMHRNPPEYLKIGDCIVSEIQCVGKMNNLVVEPYILKDSMGRC